MSKRLGLLLVAISAIAVACGAGAETNSEAAPTEIFGSEAPTTTVEVFEYATGVLAIEEVASWLIAEDGTFVTLEVGAILSQSTRAGGSFNIRLDGTVLDTHWSPVGVASRPDGETVILEDRLDGDVVEWLDANRGLRIYAAISGEGRLGTFAAVNPEDRLERDRYSLRDMLEEAGGLQLPPDPNPFSCEAASSVPDSGPGVESLVAHFDNFQNRRLDAREDYEGIADSIAEAADVVDAVTGERVEADLNHIERQLREGVAPEDVIIAPVVQVGIDATQYDRDPAFLVFATSTKEVLGWIAVSTLEDIVLIELRTPTGGDRLNVYYFPGDAFPRVECPDQWIEGAELLVSVPTDAIFGATRAIVDVGTATYRDLQFGTEK